MSSLVGIIVVVEGTGCGLAVLLVFQSVVGGLDLGLELLLGLSLLQLAEKLLLVVELLDK